MEPEASAPPIEEIAHLTLPVGDLELAHEFYVGWLGATLLRRFDREQFLRSRPERAAELDADNSPFHLALRFGDSPEVHLFLQRGLPRRQPAPHPHLALSVDHDHLDRFARRLARAGVALDGPRRLGPPGHASIYFTDPWGNLLELATLGYEGAVEHGPPDLAKLGGFTASGAHSRS